MTARGAREAAVLEVLWRAEEPMAVREVLAELNRDRDDPLAYTTVMTVLARLADKGTLTRHPRGRGYAYQPAGPDPAAIAVRSVLAEHGDAALAHFVDQVRADPNVRRRLQRLMQRSPEEKPS
ncbi:MAG: BlaI/MecI/CopY family transcriptional regulator [Streptosporangiales bacterium]|nr:BlaI/MecI/CopY family transcriptional regulator [Streptosporangiales bacterium]